jgi:hypothetical protein
MVLTILMSFLVPSILAAPENHSKKLEASTNADLFYNLDPGFTIVNFNEPSNPWVLVNYYYDNGSHIRIIFSRDSVFFPSLDMNFQHNIVQVFDNKGKLSGYGVRTRSKSNLFIFHPV